MTLSGRLVWCGRCRAPRHCSTSPARNALVTRTTTGRASRDPPGPDGAGSGLVRLVGRQGDLPGREVSALRRIGRRALPRSGLSAPDRRVACGAIDRRHRRSRFGGQRLGGDPHDRRPVPFRPGPVHAGQPREFRRTDSADRLTEPSCRTLEFVFAGRGSRDQVYMQSVAAGRRPDLGGGINPSRLFVSPDGQWIAAVGPELGFHLYPRRRGDLPSIVRLGGRTTTPPDGPRTARDCTCLVRESMLCRPYHRTSGRRTHVGISRGPIGAGVTSFGPARSHPTGATMTEGVNLICSTLDRRAPLEPTSPPER